MVKKIKHKAKWDRLARNYQKIIHFLKPYWFRSVLAAILTIPVGTMDAIIAWSLKPYMDVVLIEKNLSVSSYIPIGIIVFSLFQSGFNYYATYLNSWVGTKISNDLKYALFQKLLRQDAIFFDKSTSGGIQLRFNTDVDSACAGLLNHAKTFATRIFSSISLMCVLLINSWQLAIVALLVLGIALYPLTKIRKYIIDITTKTVITGSTVMTHFTEAFNGNRIITSYNLFNYLKQKFLGTLEDVFRLGIKMVQRTGLLSPLMHFVISVGIAVIIWLGSYLILHNQLTSGSFISFITALLLLYQPIKSMGNDLNEVQKSLMAMGRVFELMDELPSICDRNDAKRLNSIKRNIEYKNVYFEYTKNKPVLKSISLEIKVGEKIALVGNSGGGKTTFVNLLPRFYEIKSGSISIDGIDIRDLQLDSLREKIAIVFQDNFLFSGTIRDNILLGNSNISKEDLEIAVNSACLSEFVDSLELGLDTEIGERGVLLSGGQKQRIAIARAFVKNAPIVILDEATSALDNKSEATVQEAMDNLMKQRTVFIIAHRLSTVKNADKIVVINNGEIVETGTHDELLTKEKGEYASLYNMQYIKQNDIT